MENLQVIQQDSSALVAQERAQIDSQIATAKAYPRDLLRVKSKCIEVVSMDVETATSCRYVKPQAGKQIPGPSVHLARILAQQYGNIRVQQRIREVGQKEIVAEAVAHDLETNIAVSVEARRSIIDKKGKRYPDHMVNTTSMAALAIAERNAILKVIPKGLINQVYNAAFNTSNGDLSTEQKILKKKKEVLDWFKKQYGAELKDVLYALGLKSEGQIDAEQLANLRGFNQSLKDNEITPDELFGWKKKGEDAPNPLADKAKQPKKSDDDKRNEVIADEKKKTKAQEAFEKAKEGTK